MERPLIVFWHDELIFKQYHMTISAWVAPDGTVTIIPKDDGQELMISTFQSHEFCFRMDITDEKFQKINETKRGGNMLMRLLQL
jgi:hypothetical protein